MLLGAELHIQVDHINIPQSTPLLIVSFAGSTTLNNSTLTWTLALVMTMPMLAHYLGLIALKNQSFLRKTKSLSSITLTQNIWILLMTHSSSSAFYAYHLYSGTLSNKTQQNKTDKLLKCQKFPNRYFNKNLTVKDLFVMLQIMTKKWNLNFP